jgi:3-oxoacyl-[acyl-carrier protein] reductase
LVKPLPNNWPAQGATVIGTATTAAGAEAISAYLQAMDAKGAGMALNVTHVAAA